MQAAIARARASLDAGDAEATIRSANEALAHDPENAEALALKQRATALAAEQEQRRQTEARAETVVRDAQRLAEQHDLSGAVRLLAAFQPAHPLVSRALDQLRLQQDSGRAGRGIETASTGRGSVSESRDSGEGRGSTVPPGGEVPPIDVDRELTAARRAYDEGDNAASIAHFERVLAVSKTHEPARAGLVAARNALSAVAYVTAKGSYEQGDFDAAIKVLEGALKLAPGNSRLTGLLAEVEKARKATIWKK